MSENIKEVWKEESEIFLIYFLMYLQETKTVKKMILLENLVSRSRKWGRNSKAEHWLKYAAFTPRSYTWFSQIPKVFLR